MSVAARLEGLGARYELVDAAVRSLAVLLEVVSGDPEAPTTVRDPREAVDAHVADSLSALDLPAVAAAREVADVGSGAGFPGLVLAAALPGARVRLVEATGRKCDFLARAVARAGIANVEIVRSRVEAWVEGRGACDLVTARAVAPLAVLAEYAAPLLRESGTLVAWKGRRDQEEEADGAFAASELGLRADEVVHPTPFPGARDRRLHVFTKIGPTPERFPRRPGMAAKRQLRARG